MRKMLQLTLYVKERADIVVLHIVRTDFAELGAVGGVFVSNRFASETDACRLVQMIVSDCLVAIRGDIAVGIVEIFVGIDRIEIGAY